MYNLRRNDERAQAAIVLLWITVAGCIASIISSYLQYDLLLRLKSGIELSDSQLEGNDTREQIIGIIQIFILVTCAITFIQWFRRAYYNLEQIIPNKLTHSNGWAAGAWFVPILNLFRPVQMMRELYEQTGFLLKRQNIEIKTNFNHAIILWWWAFWIFSEVANRILLKFVDNSNTIDDYMNYSLISTGVELLSAVGAILAVIVVRNYAINEPLLRNVTKPSTPINTNNG